jgi:hypothetical protein
VTEVSDEGAETVRGVDDVDNLADITLILVVVEHEGGHRPAQPQRVVGGVWYFSSGR